MIRSIHIQNYRCLRDVSVDLDPLTVLVGPNGSGKSTLLDALVTLARCSRSPLNGPHGEFSFGRPGWQGSGGFDEAVFGQNSRRDIRFDAQLESEAGRGRYAVTLGRRDGRLQVVEEQLRWVGDGVDVDLDLGHKDKKLELTAYREPVSLGLPRDATLPFRVYPLRHEMADHPVVRAGLAVQRALGPSYIHEFVPSRLAAPSPQIDQMRSDGYGLVAVLDEALGRDRQGFESIEKGLQRLFPHVLGLLIRPFPGRRGEKELVLRVRAGADRIIAVPAGMAPSGVLVVIALLWVLHFRPYAVISLDEIEVHLHPWLLGKILEMVTEIAKRSQVLLATHSPETLNMLGRLDPIRVCESTADGCRVLAPGRDENNQRKLKDLFQNAVGAMWFSGLLGGVPPESDE